jgi:hypothetical protein
VRMSAPNLLPTPLPGGQWRETVEHPPSPYAHETRGLTTHPAAGCRACPFLAHATTVTIRACLITARAGLPADWPGT